MLALLINKFKKLLTILLLGALLLSNTTVSESIGGVKEYIKYTISGYEMQTTLDEEIPTWAIRKAQVVIRVGEYENKPGKRVYLHDIGLHFKDIPTDIKIHKDNDGAYIHEYDLNKKISKRIYEEMKARGIKVVYQDTYSKSQDLNAAGRIANEQNANVYLSIHTNYYNSKSKGFFIMSNQGNQMARNIADRLSSSIENNGMIPRRDALLNNGRIGEMNVINGSTVALLAELGFYSNPNELKYLMSNEYANYVANHLADEMVKVLNVYWKKY